jgi:hypothetical protein
LHIESLLDHQKQIEIWAEHNPVNFENRAAIVGAERARIEGRILDAEKLYVDPEQLGGPGGIATLKQLGVTYIVLKRYNAVDPELSPLLAELSRRGRLVAEFTPFRAGLSAADLARVEPFLHNTDTRIDDALERPGPPLEIWQLDGPDS